jgi:DnaJ-class molecular chaperone
MKKETEEFIKGVELKLHSPMEGYIIGYSRLGYLLEQYHEKQVTLGLPSVSNCPSCDSENLLKYKQHHINCKDCKEMFTMDCD